MPPPGCVCSANAYMCSCMHGSMVLHHGCMAVHHGCMALHQLPQLNHRPQITLWDEDHILILGNHFFDCTIIESCLRNGMRRGDWMAAAGVWFQRTSDLYVQCAAREKTANYIWWTCGSVDSAWLSAVARKCRHFSAGVNFLLMLLIPEQPDIRSWSWIGCKVWEQIPDTIRQDAVGIGPCLIHTGIANQMKIADGAKEQISWMTITMSL